ncbi:glycoside hydrolase family 125 protein [Seonamhaeicola aphaedonensis]|uniref:Meiotically up-regulated gene 157 (Mug157) protein n=1 Tax=Seonamhaeicola aphaedonensis TaxID=1461338 RepID=A0A3D9HEU7_9FLAO|nr:glycoside hydrolase family 125 protein [Seonamhaeicola aphaedonensis]RED47506.1 hypothetical protein DFQ02_106133 [Seonamhaeicola aphaedonensis]
MNRRIFAKQTALGTMGLALSSQFALSQTSLKNFVSKRPPKQERLFTSESIEQVIKKVKKQLKDPELAWLFENCFPNTLDTTVFYKEENGRPLTHIITGDINAMWLRDSTCQVWPYIPYTKKDKKLKKMVAGLINWQADCVLVDPYANAFKKDISEKTHWINDITDMKDELHERKWEINSLLFVIRLAYEYWKVTGDTQVFDDNWEKAMVLIYDTLKEQQRFESPGPYSFMRISQSANEVVANNGYGRPTRKIGMIHATHRQDDACVFPLYVPDNLMAVVELKHLAEMFENIRNNKKHARLCLEMADQVDEAIKDYAIINHRVFGDMYAFEVDGYGSHILLEESTVPNLMSLPYVGACSVEDFVYQNTRKWLLSDWNPKFVRGKRDEGIGSTHYAEPPKMIWPLSTISRALTANNEDEILFCIEQLKRSNAGTGFIHESYLPDNPDKFTRPWFSWVNTYFGEMILILLKKHPELLS